MFDEAFKNYLQAFLPSPKHPFGKVAVGAFFILGVNRRLSENKQACRLFLKLALN